MTISIDQATSAAREAVETMAAASRDEFALMKDHTVAIETGWIFFYNSKEFVEAGNPLAALAGNGPIYVDREGKVEKLSSAIPWQEAIKGL